MIKKFFLFYLLICSFSLIEGEEVYDLKNTYIVEIELTGSDKASIEVGMRKALKKLMIQMLDPLLFLASVLILLLFSYGPF